MSLIINPHTGEPTSPEDPLIFGVKKNRKPGHNEQLETGKPLIIPEAEDIIGFKINPEKYTLDASGRIAVVTRNRELETDLSTVQNLQLETDRQEFYDFSVSLIEEVLKTHKNKRTNLVSGDPTQFINYIEAILVAIGFKTNGKIIHKLKAFLSAEKEGELLSPIEHPFKNSSTEESEDDLSYDNLTLLFHPAIWNEFEPIQKSEILNAIILLVDFTTNLENARDGRLLLRLAEIARGEDYYELRKKILLLFEILPYKHLPEETKKTLAKMMIAHNEYGNGIASLIMVDESNTEWSHELRKEYDRYEKEVFAELSQPVADLALYTQTQWSALIRKVEQLNFLCLNSSSLNDKIGLELELAPYNGDKKSSLEKISPFMSSLPLNSSIDVDCVELRTLIGGLPIQPSTFTALQKSLRTIEHTIPSWVATLHLHIDAKTIEANEIKQDFSNVKTDTEHSTHEVRSIHPPLLSLNHINIIALEHIAQLCTSINEFTSTNHENSPNKKQIIVEGFSSAIAIHKILTIALIERGGETSTAKSRAGLLQTLKKPLPLNPELIFSLIEKSYGLNLSLIEKIYYDYIFKERQTESISCIIKYGGEAGLEFVKMLWDKTDNQDLKRVIIQSILEHNGEAGLEFVKMLWDKTDNQDLKRVIIQSITKYSGEAGLEFVKAHWDKIDNPDIKKDIIRSVTKHSGEAGLEFVKMLWDKIYAQSLQEEIIQSIAKYSGEAGLEFVKAHWDEIDNQNFKEEIILSMLAHNGEAGLEFVKAHWDEVDNRRLIFKGFIIQSILEHNGETGLEFVKAQWDEVDNPYFKEEIIRSITKYSGEAGLEFVKAHWDKIDNRRFILKGFIIQSILEHNGEVDLEFVKAHWDEIDNQDIKKNIIRSVTKHSGEAGLEFVKMLWDKTDNQGLKRVIIQSIAKYSGEAGLEFIKAHWDEVDNQYLKEEIIQSILEHNDEAGLEFVKAHWDEVDIQDIKEKMTLSILKKLKNNKSETKKFLESTVINEENKEYWQNYIDHYLI